MVVLWGWKVSYERGTPVGAVSYERGTPVGAGNGRAAARNSQGYLARRKVPTPPRTTIGT